MTFIFFLFCVCFWTPNLNVSSLSAKAALFTIVSKPFWFSQNQAVSQDTRLLVLKPEQSQANLDSWSPSCIPSPIAAPSL